MLANVFEQAGLTTVTLALVRGQAESSKPPRSLYVEFPLGRPLGRPDDVELQTDVLHAAFALPERNDVPVLSLFRSNRFRGGSFVQLERVFEGPDVAS